VSLTRHSPRAQTADARGRCPRTIGGKLDPLRRNRARDSARARRALSLTRVLGVREADVPRRLLKQAGTRLPRARLSLPSHQFRFSSSLCIARRGGADYLDQGQLDDSRSSMVLPIDLKALYRGTVASVMPRLGVVIEDRAR